MDVTKYDTVVYAVQLRLSFRGRGGFVRRVRGLMVAQGHSTKRTMQAMQLFFFEFYSYPLYLLVVYYYTFSLRAEFPQTVR